MKPQTQTNKKIRLKEIDKGIAETKRICNKLIREIEEVHNKIQRLA